MKRVPGNNFVSVIVPAYNAERTIGLCLDSLSRQSYPGDRYEIIVVDNLSTDRTRELVEKYSVRLLREENTRSSYAARNRGIEGSKGDILAFTDADCVPDMDWIASGVKSFREDTGCVAGLVKGAAGNGIVGRYMSERGVLSQEGPVTHFFRPYSQTANAFYRKSVFESVGLFEENWISGGDADLSWRMQIESEHTFKYDPAAVVRHIHRSDILSMFRQRVKWGMGLAALRSKYRGKMPEREASEKSGDIKHVLRRLWAPLREFFSSGGRRPLSERYLYLLLDLISLAGSAAGILKGAFLYRVSVFDLVRKLSRRGR